MKLTPAFGSPSWREKYIELFKSKNVHDAYDYVQRYGNEPIATDHKLLNTLLCSTLLMRSRPAILQRVQ